MRTWVLLGLLALGCKGDDGNNEDSGAVDADGDGYDAGADCDDADETVHPNADELCNGVDDDCDADIDEDPVDGTSGWADLDADGYGAGSEQALCEWASAPADNGDDCDDANAEVNPAANEVCDPDDVDEDCSGAADDADAGVDPNTRTTFWEDGDDDGYGNPDVSSERCDAPSGYVTNGDDCDDSDAALNPDAGCGVEGSYAGPWDITIDAVDLGQIITCTGSAAVVVDLAADPTIEGSYACTVSGNSIAGVITGEADGSTASGSMDLDGQAIPWTGAFGVGTLTATWVGTLTVEGLRFDYDGGMELTLE